MLLIASMLALAAILGVAAAVAVTCGVGIALGTTTWCSPLIWFVGSQIAIVVALVAGLPLYGVFLRRRLVQWWQFALTGMLCALPIWYLLAGPFSSTRWYLAGAFDSLNYLGSGAFTGLIFWWFSRLPRANAL
jgi:hypothetical protein